MRAPSSTNESNMATRYAALEGGPSAGAYTAAIAVTTGIARGANPPLSPPPSRPSWSMSRFITQLQHLRCRASQ